MARRHRYKQSAAYIAELEHGGAAVVHEVDATALDDINAVLGRCAAGRAPRDTTLHCSDGAAALGART
jgi:hypothetical protein